MATILDNQLVELCQPAIERGEPVSLEWPIRNLNRTTGTVLSSHIARRYGTDGLPPDTIRISFAGSAGQSFGAFLSKGITLTLDRGIQRLFGQRAIRRKDHCGASAKRDVFS